MSGPVEAKREVWLLWDTDQLITNVHPQAWCSGSCVIHSPSEHFLRNLPLGFHVPTRTFYRTCEHGAKHGDPDERTYWTNLKLKSRNAKTQSLAREKLSAFACPDCICGCCDITKV